MGEVIFIRHGLFGPRTSRMVSRHGAHKRASLAVMKIGGRMLVMTGRFLRAAFISIWILLFSIAMLPVLALYAVFFILLLALGFGILFDVGRALSIFGG